MSQCGPFFFMSKLQKKYEIRTAQPRDAGAVLSLQKEFAQESVYALHLPEELVQPLEEEERRIELFLRHVSSLLLVAVSDLQVIGILDFSAGHRQRIAHTGDFELIVSSSWREQGIGRSLLGVLLDYARAHPCLEKVNLKVHSSNQRAIGLYRSLGFSEEGRLRKDLKMSNTEYVDTVLMGKLVK